MKLLKLFTIEKSNDYNYRPGARIPVGTLIRTVKGKYSYGDDKDGPRVGVVTGYVNDAGYEVSEGLQAQGYTHHEVYSVKLDNSETTVLWPDEIEVR